MSSILTRYSWLLLAIFSLLSREGKKLVFLVCFEMKRQEKPVNNLSKILHVCETRWGEWTRLSKWVDIVGSWWAQGFVTINGNLAQIERTCRDKLSGIETYRSGRHLVRGSNSCPRKNMKQQTKGQSIKANIKRPLDHHLLAAVPRSAFRCSILWCLAIVSQEFFLEAIYELTKNTLYKR